MAERELKLEQITGIRLVKPLKLATGDLVGVATAYLDNVTRVKALSLFPILSITTAIIKERIAGAAVAAVTGSPDEKGDLTRAQKQQCTAIAMKMWRDEVKAQTKERTRERMAAAMRHIQGNVRDDRMAAGIEAWLSAQVVGAWTAFETMSGDLWEAALNCHPAGLAELKGKKSIASEDGKSVPLVLLQKYKYDLSNSMGSVLKEKRSFDRLINIRQFYAEAFYEHAEKISKILSDEALDALSAVRNLIVHRALVADAEYLARAKNLPGAPKADKGKKIILDGEVVANLAEPVMQLGSELIVAVDSWIASH